MQLFYIKLLMNLTPSPVGQFGREFAGTEADAGFPVGPFVDLKEATSTIPQSSQQQQPQQQPQQPRTLSASPAPASASSIELLAGALNGDLNCDTSTIMYFTGPAKDTVPNKQVLSGNLRKAHWQIHLPGRASVGPQGREAKPRTSTATHCGRCRHSHPCQAPSDWAWILSLSTSRWHPRRPYQWHPSQVGADWIFLWIKHCRGQLHQRCLYPCYRQVQACTACLHSPQWRCTPRPRCHSWQGSSRQQCLLRGRQPGLPHQRRRNHGCQTVAARATAR